ncbi:MAG: type I phosphomannose isomerase catalytic subunit [Eubacteriales bacterium]
MNPEQGKKILKLSETRVWRTYQGGVCIDAFHGRTTGENGNFPEDWVGSCTRATNPGREEIPEGLSRVENLPQMPLLAEILEENPENYFGKKHLEVLGKHAGMLIKLIDAQERLTIQVHPDKKFAKEILHSDYGKTESWYILDTFSVDGEVPSVYFGFKPHVTKDLWADLFHRQDIPAMLDSLHKIPVKAGDSFFIPGGLPHAIGSGCFLAEIQEPTDYTMRTELTTPSGLKIHETLCHQGVGVEKMLDCFHYDGLSLEETLEKWKISPVMKENSTRGVVESFLDDRYTDLFSFQRITVQENLELPMTMQLSVWIVTKGQGTIQTDWESCPCQKGEFLLLPASIPSLHFQGNLELLQCLPKKL